MRNNQETDFGVRPAFLFKDTDSNHIKFMPPILSNQMSNINVTVECLRKWIDEDEAKFHHNYSKKQEQLIQYIHPETIPLII